MLVSQTVTILQSESSILTVASPQHVTMWRRRGVPVLGLALLTACCGRCARGGVWRAATNVGSLRSMSNRLYSFLQLYLTRWLLGFFVCLLGGQSVGLFVGIVIRWCVNKPTHISQSSSHQKLFLHREIFNTEFSFSASFTINDPSINQNQTIRFTSKNKPFVDH